MLNGKLELHGEDVEPFVARRVEFILRRHNIELDFYRREDLMAFCMAELWVASRNFDEGRFRSYRQFANAVVFNNAIDWLRSNIGRVIWRFSDHIHERDPLTEKHSNVRSFDLPLDESESRRLGDTVAASIGRGEADRGADVLLGLLHQRSSQLPVDKPLVSEYGSGQIAA